MELFTPQTQTNTEPRRIKTHTVSSEGSGDGIGRVVAAGGICHGIHVVEHGSVLAMGLVSLLLLGGVGKEL